ncbi:MAG TPA: kelch repeat-containing protein, partial [Tepidisphaeraceae bacterium]
MENRVLFSGFEAHVSFQPANVPAPAGYVADSGALYGDQGNGFSYGWNGGKLPAVTRTRHAAKPARNGPDGRYDSFALLNPKGRGSQWQIAVPDGQYTVHLVAGSPIVFPALYRVDVDGSLVLDGRATMKNQWVEATSTLTITNGMLTVTAPQGTIDRLDYIDITAIVTSPVPPAPPSPPVPPSPPAPLSLTWTQVTDSPTPRLEASAVTVGNLLYVFGGYGTDSPNYLATKETDSYDPATDTWARLADMPEGLTHMGAATDG